MIDSPKAEVVAFLTGVSFPRQQRSKCNVARAYVHIEDDADGSNKFKLAVPHEFGLLLAKHLNSFPGEGESDPRIRITLEVTK
jgi:hypothetical protein